jgi:cystathionine gamma-lyase
MRLPTRVIRAGHAAPRTGEPLHGGVTFASTFHTPGDPFVSPYTYGRMHNPTWTAFETALAELEGAPAYAFASGIAAVAAVFGAVLRPGDVVVIPSDSYYTVRLLTDGYFSQIGVHVRKAPTRDSAQIALLDGAKLLWIETPSNPLLDVADIRRLVEAAHARGVLVAVDNTTATSTQPLALGADFSVASDTKGLSGHSDVLLGHVAAADPALLEKIYTWRTQIGAIPGPMEVWLAHRSLATAYLRLEKQSSSALTIAQYLQARPEVTDVRYPGLAHHPAHALAAQQMRFFGSVVSFTLRDQAAAERFLSACQLIIETTSFGGIHTTAERRARWGGDAVADGFIRMNVGCEDADDIIDDLAAALGT